MAQTNKLSTLGPVIYMFSGGQLRHRPGEIGQVTGSGSAKRSRTGGQKT